MDVLPLSIAASSIDDLAATLSARAGLIAVQLGATRWYSPAARMGLPQVEQQVMGLLGCARRMSAFADDVRTLATRLARLP